MRLFSTTRASLIIIAMALFGCEQEDVGGNDNAVAAGQERNLAARATHILETEKPVFSIALIPAGDQHQPMTIAAAHGDDGVAIYDLNGSAIWSEPGAAKLVAYYQNNLVIYRDGSSQSILDRYNLDQLKAPVKISTASPSPIAATTLQRTTYATLGPLRIAGEEINTSENALHFDKAVAAVAASSKSAPDYPDGAAAVAMTDGDIQIYPLTLFTGKD